MNNSHVMWSYCLASTSWSYLRGASYRLLIWVVLRSRVWQTRYALAVVLRANHGVDSGNVLGMPCHCNCLHVISDLSFVLLFQTISICPPKNWHVRIRHHWLIFFPPSIWCNNSLSHGKYDIKERRHDSFAFMIHIELQHNMLSTFAS